LTNEKSIQKASAQQRKKSLVSRDSLQSGDKIFATYTSDKRLIARKYRKLKKLTLQESTTH
jgi:hypothetical protein